MKSTTFLFIIIVFTSCQVTSNVELESFNLSNGSPLDSILLSAESNINNATIYCLHNSKNTDSLSQVLNKLKRVRINDDNGPICCYWQGYCCYKIALTQVSLKKEERTNLILDEGITVLSKIKIKNSETYALLSALYGCSIKYCSITTLVATAQKAKICSEKAIKMNPHNIRAYITAAINDFYTPAIYSSGKLVENYLLTALNLNDRIDPNLQYLPSWGRSSIYEFLIRYYIRIKKHDTAQKYLSEAIFLYPDQIVFTNLKKRIVF